MKNRSNDLTDKMNPLATLNHEIVVKLDKIYEQISIKLKQEIGEIIVKGLEQTKLACKKNVKDGWAFLMSYTPREYIKAMDLPRDEKDKYFVDLIDSNNYFEEEYENLKTFMGEGWIETLIESYAVIKEGFYRPIIPLFITMLEKGMNKVIGGEKNYFGSNLKEKFEKRIKRDLENDEFVKPMALQLIPLFNSYVFKNNVYSYDELPIFNRNLIQHGNDYPDRWGKTDFYKIFTLICGLSYIYSDLNNL